MGTYGVSKYGLAKYGTDIRAEFDVSPFTATPADYSTVLLDWTAPAGSWDTLRLLRNRYGWAVNENDGEILLNQTHKATSFVDKDVTGGHWQYYTIFIQASGQWSRAGTVACLMPKDNGYTDLLYSLLPEHYKVDVAAGNIVSDDSNTLNPYLRPFLSIFAFGFDMVKSYYDSNRYTNDAMRTRFDNIAQLATQFGVQYEASTPAYLFRQRVRDAATLGRQKGTLEQIRSIISETTGYDADLRIGYNLMLSDDQADFDHPSFPQWDAGVNYAAGDSVGFGAYLYKAGSSGAYGASQAPTGTATSNSYWTVVQYGTDSTLVDANGLVAGWEQVSFTTGVTPGTGGVLVGIGVQNPTNPDDKAGNALWVRNTNSGGVVATMGVRSVGRVSGQSSMDPQQPVLYGIPLPYTWQAWDDDVYYQPGDMVIYHGRVYQALTASLNVTPPDTPTANTQWTPLGYDERVQMCLSGYAQAYSGEQVNVYPFVEYYDAHGALITSLYSDALPAYTVLDSFTQGWSDWTARTSDLGAASWTETVGQWTSGGYGGGCAYPVGATASIATTPGHADGTVSATFLTRPSGALNQAVVFRLQDSSNYWRASRTGLHRVESGSWVATYSYSQTFLDGDRITVEYSGSNITVYRNGTQVLTLSNSTFSTATRVGMAVA
ncbi:phage tail protein [Streptomyces sp. NPDC002088]|uniref:phage tail protein n=1 Tax=Streptomyces sp. NPDC002088 TaxID=3154665 RepID=UPI0033260FAD